METIGDRVFAVRAALGEGARKPLPLRELAQLLTERSGGGRKYHASQLSGWETGASEPPVSDVAVIASVDPLERGPAWLAFGETQHGSPASTQRREPMVAPEDGLVPSPRATPARRRANGSP